MDINAIIRSETFFLGGFHVVDHHEDLTAFIRTQNRVAMAHDRHHMLQYRRVQPQFVAVQGEKCLPSPFFVEVKLDEKGKIRDLKEGCVRGVESRVRCPYKAIIET